MKRRALPWMSALAALLALALAMWLSAQRQPETRGGERQPVLPGLAGELDDLDRLRITKAGAAVVVTLQRGEAGWTVAERDGWPADVGQLRSWLQGLSSARLLEAKTSRPENYPQLGVTDPVDPDSKAVQAELDIGDRTRSLIIGHSNPNGRGSFVRVPGQSQSWLADADLAIESDPSRWLDRSLLSVPPDRIASVRIERPDAAAQEVIRDVEAEGQPLRLVPLPAGRVAHDTALYAVAGFLEGLRLDDVRRAPAPEAAPELTATFARLDGLTIQVSLWPDEEAAPETVTMPWARLSVAFDEQAARAWLAAEVEKDRIALEESGKPPAGSVAEVDGDSQAETEAATAAAQAVTESVEALPMADPDTRLAALREESAGLQERVDGWLFRLPAFKLANLRRPPEDFLVPAD